MKHDWSEDGFADFVARLRAGDRVALAELMDRYGAAIRLEIRYRLTHPALRRVLDPEDVCQSVFAGFLAAAAAGRYELDRPERLGRLLLSIARKKVAMKARRETALRRNSGRPTRDVTELEIAGDDPSPSRVLISRELWDAALARMSEQERSIARLRAQGIGWAEIVDRLGGTTEGRRKQFARVVERVARELGIDHHDR